MYIYNMKILRNSLVDIVNEAWSFYFKNEHVHVYEKWLFDVDNHFCEYYDQIKAILKQSKV